MKNLSIIIASILFFSCSKNSEFVVNFDSNGGSHIAAQTVNQGDNATEPFIAPTKANNKFVGWFSYDNVFDKWDFAITAITSDITLYAKWTSIPIEDSYITKTVSLMERDDYAVFERTTVILYEDENFLIKTPLFNYLRDVIDYLATSTRGSSESGPFIEQLIFDGEKTHILYSSSYFSDKLMFDQVLSIFLENGQCYVNDKVNKNTIMHVSIERWEAIGELSPLGGRIFYFQKDVQFLKTIDWASIGI
jgi:uncharacterized repeat protein (TIGR02543 family)